MEISINAHSSIKIVSDKMGIARGRRVARVLEAARKRKAAGKKSKKN